MDFFNRFMSFFESETSRQEFMDFLLPEGLEEDEDKMITGHISDRGEIVFSVFAMEQWELILEMSRIIKKDVEEIVKDLGPDEAARALASIEEEFWATKAGQKLQREGTEKSFADFIHNVPAAALADSGLKRHYKQPETLHALQLLHHKSPAEELGAALT